jgi:S-formylglutathione hydrolase FrmB
MALGILVPSACNKPDKPDDNGQTNLIDLLNAEDKLYQDLTIQSQYKGQKMTYSVWLPNGYDENKDYPFLYLLHGYETGDQSHLDRYWVEKGNAQEIARKYLKDGGVPMIIIMPNGLSDFYIGFNNQDYEKYFHQELMPKVEKSFKCNGKRAIAGLSMGGFGTLYYALSYPEKFTYAYAMSPATSMSWFISLDGMKAKAAALATVNPHPDFTIEVGNQDTTVSNEDAKALSDAINAVAHCEWIARDGIHYWDFWQVCLEKALKKVGESFK